MAAILGSAMACKVALSVWRAKRGIPDQCEPERLYPSADLPTYGATEAQPNFSRINIIDLSPIVLREKGTISRL